MSSKDIYYIYLIKNRINDKIYVGKSKNPQKRWKEHLKNSKKENLSFKSALYSAMKLHGSENFYMEVIACSICSDDVNFLERFFIQQMNTISPNGYNIHIGGNGGNILLPTQITLKDAKTRKFVVVEKSDPRIKTGELIGKNSGMKMVHIDEKTYVVDECSPIYKMYQDFKQMIKDSGVKKRERINRKPIHSTKGMVRVIYIETLERKFIKLDSEDIKNRICFRLGSYFKPITDGEIVYGSIMEAARTMKRDRDYVKRRVEKEE